MEVFELILILQVIPIEIIDAMKKVKASISNESTENQSLLITKGAPS